MNDDGRTRGHCGCLLIMMTGWLAGFLAAGLADASVLSADPCHNGSRAPKRCVEGLIGHWSERDGAAFWQVGFALSETLVGLPIWTLESFSDQPEEFEQWVAGLSEHTFAPVEYGSSLQTKMWAASLAVLRVEMLTALDEVARQPSLAERFAGMIGRLREELDSIEIRAEGP